MKRMLFLTALAFSNTLMASEIIQIEVLNNDFKVIRTVDDDKTISAIKREWANFEKIKVPPNYEWKYKIDITGGSLSGRWLYNEAGYISKLNKKLEPSYKINNLESFINALGL